MSNAVKELNEAVDRVLFLITVARDEFNHAVLVPALDLLPRTDKKNNKALLDAYEHIGRACLALKDFNTEPVAEVIVTKS